MLTFALTAALLLFVPDASGAAVAVSYGCCTANSDPSITSKPACANVQASDCDGLKGFGGFIAGGVCNLAGVCVGSGATGSGDPVMNGFDNSMFEFFGKPGFNYSVLADASLAVNMQLVPAGPNHIRHQGGEGTFAGGVGVVVANMEVVAHVNEPGNMTFAVNGTSANIEVPSTWDRITYEPYVPDLGQVLTVSKPPFNLKFVAVKAFTDDISGYNRGHFDFSVELTGPASSSVSGVLGQTLGFFDAANIREEDFEIPSLSYFSLNQARSSVSRRLASLLPEAFPLHAGLHARARAASTV